MTTRDWNNTMPRLVSGENDLQTRNITLAKEWHPSLNNDLKPCDVSQFSNKKAWWLGKCGHEWEALIAKRSSGRGCPYCSNNKVLAGFNDLLSQYPKIAKEWNHVRNDSILLKTMSPRSNKKVWWVDSFGHEWETTPDKRTSRSQGCPVCSGVQRLEGFNDLETKYPLLFKEWSPKNTLLPNDPMVRGESKILWIGECGHEWVAVLEYRKAGSGCHICSNNAVQKGVNSFDVSYPELLKEWDFDKNVNISPYDFSSGMHTKVWWIGLCEHSWIASINHRTSGKGCAVCAGKQLQKGINDLKAVNPTLANEFHPTKNRNVEASDVIANSHTKVWWIGSCLHEWQADPHHRMTGVGCPFCAGKQILPGYNDLPSLFPATASEWNHTLNGILEPGDFTSFSGKKVWWRCSQNHEYQATIVSRTRNNSGCAKCIQASTSKIQQAFHKALKSHIPDLECDVRIPVPFKSRKSMAVDMVSIASNVAIEYDGEYYHSGQRSGKTLDWHLSHDGEKTQALLDAGYIVIRIRENALQHLDMVHERLIQVSYKHGDVLDATVASLLKFVATSPNLHP